jgi:hypothetical protein
MIGFDFRGLRAFAAPGRADQDHALVRFGLALQTTRDFAHQRIGGHFL